MAIFNFFVGNLGDNMGSWTILMTRLARLSDVCNNVWCNAGLSSGLEAGFGDGMESVV